MIVACIRHCPEFVKLERLAAQSDALASEYDRSAEDDS
jgi:hypothetical protein